MWRKEVSQVLPFVSLSDLAKDLIIDKVGTREKVF